MRRIKVFFPVSTRGIGGGERYVLSIIERLDRDKFSINVAAPRNTLFYRKASSLCDDIQHIPFLDNADMFSFVRNFSLCRKAHVIHANLNRACFFSTIAGKLLGRPVISTMHGIDKRIYYRFSDKIVFLSEYQKKLYGDLSQGVHIPIGVDLRAFPFSEDTSHSRINIGVLARLHHLKGHLTAVRTASILKERGVDFHLFIIGDGEYRARIEKEVNESGLCDEVTFTGNLSDPARFIRENISIGMLASEKENIPMSNLEYMAMGIPVVCSDVGGVAEQLSQECIVSDARNAEDFCRKILQLSEDEAFRRQTVDRNFSHVVKKWNSDIMVDRLEELYEKRAYIFSK